MAASKKSDLASYPFGGRAAPTGRFWIVLAFEAAILYISGHIPKIPYAMLASPFKRGCRMPTNRETDIKPSGS